MLRLILFRWWTPAWRAFVFILAASSIWCLLADFYGILSMRMFTFCISIPALLVLSGMCAVDQVVGDRRLIRGVVIGCIAGLVAALAYDAFRLPFVYSRQWNLSGLVWPMPLFKVFPRFGAMILGQPIEQTSYSLSAHLIGWGYHFSNGMTFGIMYTAAVGEPMRRHWVWCLVMAVGLELAMLLTPYPTVFGIALGARFVAVTLAAHLIFGLVLGLLVKVMAKKWQPDTIEMVVVR